MGTRSTTHFIQVVTSKDWRTEEVATHKSKLLTFYRQMDGYPTGHGRDLFEAITSYTIVNGLGAFQSNSKIANGVGCLVAQLLGEFKDGQPGGIYVTAPTDRQEYNYFVTFEEDWVKGGPDVSTSVRVTSESGRKLFNGTLAEFGAWVNEEADD